ncbi:uncharacterized protein LOC142557916 [Dermacentor variabilis]|uniref:uncharacterized protein LOC142557916 n=1 Tax=Dermacentor variabilis TaxID=34621 RepID=UPI003F5B48A1
MCIEERGIIAFQNAAGVTLEDFLTLLEAYLNSTFISFDKQLFLQKRGICIGSCIAPLLCNIFFSSVDQLLEEAFKQDSTLNILKVFRYMDDFLILFNRQGSLKCCDDILNIFRDNGKGLLFTHEVPQRNTLQFLDLRLTFHDGQVCWQYFPRAKKGLLPYNSCHFKIVKRGIAMLCLESALEKSCTHTMQASFNNQIKRLKEARFPDSLVTSVTESLLRKVNGTSATREEERARTVRPAVIPYVHKVSHNLKKVAGRYGVPIAFSAPVKLGRLCSKTTRDETGSQGCGKKHSTSYGRCATGVVYEIPLECGKSYIGQTGRCISERAREHELNLMKDGVAHLPAHCKACIWWMMQPPYQNTTWNATRRPYSHIQH